MAGLEQDTCPSLCCSHYVALQAAARTAVSLYVSSIPAYTKRPYGSWRLLLNWLNSSATMTLPHHTTHEHDIQCTAMHSITLVTVVKAIVGEEAGILHLCWCQVPAACGEQDVNMARAAQGLKGQKGGGGLTLKAMPVSLSFSSGSTLPTALAAPVELGMMLAAALRPPRQSLAEGPSTVFWVAVVECTVVIRASSMPKASCTTCGKRKEKRLPFNDHDMSDQIQPEAV